MTSDTGIKAAEDLSFNRMMCDSDKSFEAYVVYRNLGLDRSLAKVARRLGKSKKLIERWSRNGDWVQRVANYDNEMDRRCTRQDMLDREAARIRHLRIVRRQQKLAEQELGKHERRSNMLPDDVPSLEADKAAKMEQEAVKLERLILGDPTEIQENRGTEVDWSKLDVEEIHVFKALVIKLRGSHE